METPANVEEVTEVSTPSPENAEIISQEESAPSEETEKTEVSETSKTDEKDRVQDRINKITAEKYGYKNDLEAERQKNIDLQAQIAKNVVPIGDAPTMESCGYDEEVFSTKMHSYAVKTAQADVQKTESERVAADARIHAQKQANERIDSFLVQAKEFEKEHPDYFESVKKTPLNNPIAGEAIMKQGPEVLYHLSKRFDLVDKINNMSAVDAVLEIMRISNEVKTVNKKLTTDAPPPIEPIGGSGGGLNTSLPGEELIKGAKFS